MSEMAKKKRFNFAAMEVPHTCYIIFVIIVICAILTYIVPAGQYDTVETASGGKVLDPLSFHYVESNPTTLYQLFNAVPEGMVKMASLIFFVFIAGGTFGVINETKTLEIAVNRLAQVLQGKERIMIFLIMTLFSVLSALMGFNTESIIFIPLGVALARKVGYDSITGVAMVMCGTYVGFTCGAFNPYTTAVAQGIVGLPTFSGLEFRLLMHACILVVTALYVIRYAERIRKTPEKSFCYKLEQSLKDTQPELALTAGSKFSPRNILVVVTMIVAFTFVIYSAIALEWTTSEMAPIFFAMGIISGLIGGMKGNQICKAWLNGARTMVFGALVIGMGRGVLLVMENGYIFHTIVHGLASVLQLLPPALVAVGMFLSNIVINFFVPSGSGQATLVMPIMGPLAQLTGVSQQTAILAFQCGDGFTNTVIPTSSTTNACIGVANVGFTQWFRFALPLTAIQWGMSAVFIVIAHFIGL